MHFNSLPALPAPVVDHSRGGGRGAVVAVGGHLCVELLLGGGSVQKVSAAASMAFVAAGIPWRRRLGWRYDRNWKCYSKFLQWIDLMQNWLYTERNIFQGVRT